MPPFYCLKLSFDLGGDNLGCPPLSLPKIQIWLRGGGDFHLQSQYFIGLRLTWKFEQNPSWLNFCLIWGCPAPLFSLNLSFGLGGGFFHLQSQSFIGLRLPWNFEQNPSWLNFWLIRGAPPFLHKIEFWLKGGKIILAQSHSLIGLRLPWKFEQNPSWLNFCLILGAPPPLFLPKIKFWLSEGGDFHL